MIGVFVANADGNFLITVYGQIASEFEHFSNAGWLLLMYPLATCATQTLVRALDLIVEVISLKRHVPHSMGSLAIYMGGSPQC